MSMPSEFSEASVPLSSAFTSTVDANPEFQVHEVVRTIRSHILLLASFIAIGLVLALAVNAASTRMYSSTATIEINKEEGTSLGLNDLSGLAAQITGGEDLTTDLLTQKAVIQSGSVAANVIDRLHLATVTPYAAVANRDGRPTNDTAPGRPVLDMPPKERVRIMHLFASRLSVELIKDTRLITVTYTDSNPERAASVANMVVDSYTMQYAQARYAASAKTSAWLSDQLTDLKNRVIESQQRVADYQARTGLIGTSEAPSTGATTGSPEDSVTLNRYLELNRELTNAEVARISKEAIYRMTDTEDPDVVLGVVTSQLGIGAGASSVLSASSAEVGMLTTLRQQKSQLALQEAGLASKFGSKSPQMMQLQDEMVEVNAQIQAELRRIHDRAKSDLQLAQATEDGLSQSIAEEQQVVLRLSNGTNQFLLLQQEATSSRMLYQDLYSKLAEANVVAGIRASNITIVDPAQISSSPSLPHIYRNLLSGVLLGLFGGLVVIFAIDFLSDKLITPEQLETISRLPLLAVIPMLEDVKSKYGSYLNAKVSPLQSANGNESQSWILRHPASAGSEAFRNLRSSLLLSRARRPPKRVLITSPLNGDGKSTVCFNIAVAFALQGSKVLLLDADLRRPRLQKLTEVESISGLGSYLSSESPFVDAVQPYKYLSNLHVMPCGTIPPMPSELLGSTRFTELLDIVSQEYDFVFIDSPPILLVTDALVIAPHVDNTLIVVRSNKTTRQMFRRTIARLQGQEEAHFRLVLNGLDRRTGEYGYYYGKNQYYKEK